MWSQNRNIRGTNDALEYFSKVRENGDGDLLVDSILRKSGPVFKYSIANSR